MEHKVTLVVGKNGSIEVIDEDEETEHWGELLSLGFLLVLSTSMNLGLAGAALLGRARGTSEISPLVVALCVSNTLDSMVNHTLALMFLALWPDSSPPSILCRLSAASYLSALLVQPLYILSHFLSKATRKRSTSQLHQRWFIAAPPLLTVALSVPVIILPNVITVRHFINRHVCCLTGENSSYSAGLIFLGFFLPWAALGYCSTMRKCSCDGTHHCYGEDRELKYLIAAVILAFILVLPAIISFSVVSMTNLNRLLTYKDSDDDIVIITGTYDTVLTWTRFSFNLFCCLAMLVFFDGLWLECSRICMLIKKRSFSSSYNLGNLRQSKNMQSQGGPILFVTSGGLMLLNASANDCMPLERCDLVEREQKSSVALQTNSLIAQPSSTSPVTPKVRKKWDKNAKRKIVRFAQSVKEIPHFLDD